MPPPLRFFLGYFQEDKTSTPNVFSRWSFILRTHFETSSVMISFYGYEVCWYDVISSRWSSHFERKCMFFPTFSTIKVNLVDKIMQSAYLCVIIHVKQLPFLAVLT